MNTAESPQSRENGVLMEALYAEARRLGAQAAAADLPSGAVRQQSEALCRAQGWAPSDPQWYEVALAAYRAYVAAKQHQSPYGGKL